MRDTWVCSSTEPCGELREGGDGPERTGFLALLHDAQLEATGGVPDPIFHKRALDAVPSGAKLATDVRPRRGEESSGRHFQ